MKRLLAWALVMPYLVLVAIPAQSQTHELKAVVNFDYDDDQLNKRSRFIIDSLLKQIPEGRLVNVQIHGHTDQRGNQAYNLKLSEARVSAVKTYLVLKNLHTTHVKTEAFGKAKLLTLDDQDQTRRINRRVEITLVYQTAETKQTADDDENYHIQELYDQLSTDEQHFKFIPTKDTAYRSKHGSVFYFKANSFQTKAGGKNDTLTIKIKEAFDYATMVSENLSTVSDGMILESQGMFDVRAFNPLGSELFLRTGHDYVALIPVDEIKPKMEIFTGTWHNGNVNWKTLRSKNQEKKALTNFKMRSTKSNANQRTRRTKKARGNRTCYVYEYSERRPKNCPFFFCKIKQFINPRRKPSKYRKQKQKIDCELLNIMNSKYGISNITSVINALNKPTLDSIANLPEAQRANAYQTFVAQNAQNALTNNSGSVGDMSYLLFANTEMRWANIDEFMSAPKDQLLAISVPLKYSKSHDAKLLFKKRKVIYPAIEEAGQFSFPKVLKNQDAILVALSYTGGKPKICIQEINTSDNIKKIEWEETTVAALKERLKVLNV